MVRLTVRELTEQEQKAIDALREVADHWPDSLMLFSWNGLLCVMDSNKLPAGEHAILDTIPGIPNDGGDPDAKSSQEMN